MENENRTNPEVAAAPKARRVSHLWPVVSAIVALLLAFGLGALVVLRSNAFALGVDTEWMDELVENRAPFWEVPALVMNYLGGGVIGVFLVPIIVIVALLFAKRPWGALYYFVATVLSAGVVQLLKQLFGRSRPEDILVVSDFGSFPSGHVANAATMAVALAIIFPKVWVWIAGAAYTVLMLLSRTYLGAHWLTDTIGGLLLGAGVAVVLWAPLAAKLDGEHTIVTRDPSAPQLQRKQAAGKG
ncbi:MAG: phosphoesterase PA-phosphatase [Cryobacterium sp.]|jgi:membrane-associated phospholipid phosphatase|nr:phosphoesterase PA-phosphatase [Cryobacterium sp.]